MPLTRPHTLCSLAHVGEGAPGRSGAVLPACRPTGQSLLIPFLFGALSSVSIPREILQRYTVSVAVSGFTLRKPPFTMKSSSRSVVSDSLQPNGLYSPWSSPGQNTGVGSLYLLQGIFPPQGSNPGLPHCRRILYQLSQEGSPTL